jgi:hypothetical protein
MKTKKFKTTIDWGFDAPETYSLRLVTENYRDNGSLAIVAMEGNEEFAVITVNLPYSEADETHAYIDTNNCPWAEKMLTENGFAKPTGDYGFSGWCQYPLYEFDLTKFSK